MNRDLFLSILALDSYNRGYGERIKLTGDTTRLGNADISSDALVRLGENRTKAADFYAIAYNWNGETVISYRGTDNFLADAVTGYGTALGLANQSQANLAIEFYTDVSGKFIHDISTPSNIVVTGHSLGGGLAGLVSMLSGVEGVGFDHMPFAAAGVAQAIRRIKEQDLGFADIQRLPVNERDKLVAALTQLYDLARYDAEAFQLAGLHYPTLGAFRGDYVESELLKGVRDGTTQGVVGAILSLALGPGVAAYGLTQQLVTAIYESAIPKHELATYGAEFPVPALVSRHSQALLVMLKYAETVGVNAAWQSAATYVLPALYQDRIAEALGRTTGPQGLYAPNDQLKAAIAYSAIDEGERPFGDQGIKAFFDDAVDLGRAVSRSGVSSGFLGGADELAQIVTQYAGRLAFADVEGGGWGDDGVLALNAAQTVMSIDISDATWDAGKAHQEMEIIGLSRFIQSVVGESGFPINVYGPFGGGTDGIEWNSPVRAANDNVTSKQERAA